MGVRTLRQWRYAKAVGLRELAGLAGVSTYTLSALEHGRSRGYPKTWRKIAEALGVEPEQIAEYRRAVGLDKAAEQHDTPRPG
jgi:transcriptional regulator with XRE-family HTH domain